MNEGGSSSKNGEGKKSAPLSFGAVLQEIGGTAVTAVVSAAPSPARSKRSEDDAASSRSKRSRRSEERAVEEERA
eukprot:56795-Karenia_brevis.AAC.1